MKFHKSIRDNWFKYKQIHILANQYYKIKRGRNFLLTNFLKNITGTTVSIDSFFPGDVIYEFGQAKTFWPTMFNTTPIFIEDYREIPTVDTFDTVVVLGQLLFRYKTVDECIQQLTYLKKLMQGSMIVCLPVGTLQYHKLKYSEAQIVEYIVNQSGMKQIDFVTDLHYNNIYLWITSKT